LRFSSPRNVNAFHCVMFPTWSSSKLARGRQRNLSPMELSGVGAAFPNSRFSLLLVLRSTMRHAG
jgi:hypothetical protein